jgi:hypothetical protein
MKNVTISLDDETASWARLHAARQGKSVSRMVSELLHDHMRDSRQYAEAMRRYLSRPPVRLRTRGSYPRREDLHERSGVR